MTTPKCPPFEIDEEILGLLETYRAAKRSASSAMRGAAAVEREGHYDKDTPLQTRTAQEGEAMNTERSTAIRVADALVAWVDKAKR
jgi:hypothetical protein